MDKRYQVFVSSTFTDLKEERKAIIEGLLNAKYIPAGMEMFAASNDEQFKYIKKIIDTCDYYVLIVGARYGSLNPSTGKSFTEQEYDYAVERGIPVLAFLHDDPYNLPVEKRDDENRELLENFRNKASDGRMCKMWHTSSELISSVIISLGEEVANNPQVGWTRGSIEDSVELLTQINELRIKLDEKEKQIHPLQKALKEYTDMPDDLACGRDYYKIVGMKEVYNGTDGYGHKKYKDEQRVKEMTWDAIFSAFAPYLFSYVNYESFSSALKKGINSVIDNESFFGSINEDCIQTIKIQLNALGLIEVSPKKSTGMGVIEFIKLTEKGKTYLLKLKSVKKG